MLTTTMHDVDGTLTRGGHVKDRLSNELFKLYSEILEHKRFPWTLHMRFGKLLGRGGQGVVYLTRRCGADGFTVPVAIKVFSPERYSDGRGYDEAMQRMARVASGVAQIQHDNLIYVHDFVDRFRIRMMIMEWVDGLDLHRLLTNQMLDMVRDRVSNRRFEYINRVIVTSGPVHPRVKPGVAVAIVRDCLSGLAALHREEVVHGDIKPSNIMLKRIGSAKLVDIGSAFEMTAPPKCRCCTPAYAAPEVLEGSECTPRSDLASLGYVLIELLGGRPLFAGMNSSRELLEAKRLLPHRLHDILPQDCTVNELLMNFCRGLIAPDPMRRFPSAEAADLL
jgi:serine/threonine-protein kinase